MPDYYYFPSRTPRSQQVGVSPLFGLQPEINLLTDATNPVFNFTQDFVEKFQQVTPARMAQALPYIAISILNSQGDVITDYNVSFLQKGIDMSAMQKGARYADRPLISLENISVSEDLAAGGGLVAWTNVTMQFKLHKPDFITDNSLYAMLFSGMPLRVVYGWSANSQQDFLGAQELLLFNTRDYTINFDPTGQGVLTVNGMGHGDNFATVLVGDYSAEQQEEAEIEDELSGISDLQAYNLKLQAKRLELYSTFITSEAPQGQNNNDVTNAMQQQPFYDLTDTINDQNKLSFALCLDNLAEKIVERDDLFDDVESLDDDGSTASNECVTLHDVMSSLLAPTLDQLHGTVIPGDKEYRIVYGCFNENAGPDYADQCLAYFPIYWLGLIGIFNEAAEGGIPVPSIQFVLERIKDVFLCSESYWRQLLHVDDQTKIDMPKVTIAVTSHFGPADESGKRKEIVQIALYDINQNVPLTQLKLESAPSPSSEADRIKACIGDPPTVPIIRLGNANSFVKSISMENMIDATYKAFLINRYSGPTSDRQFLLSGVTQPPPTYKTPYIPFKGTMEVIGHTEWKPGRFFFLATGFFFIDGVYNILAVHHTLDAQGFRTSIDFSRH